MRKRAWREIGDREHERRQHNIIIKNEEEREIITHTRTMKIDVPK